MKVVHEEGKNIREKNHYDGSEKEKGAGGGEGGRAAECGPKKRKKDAVSSPPNHQGKGKGRV